LGIHHHTYKGPGKLTTNPSTKQGTVSLTHANRAAQLDWQCFWRIPTAYDDKRSSSYLVDEDAPV